VKSFSRSFSSRLLPLGGGSCNMQNQTSICCWSHDLSPQKIELVISCQSRNNPKGASGACAPSPSRLLARPGRPHAEESRLFFQAAALRCRLVFLLY
jgi:hypothetical protein